MAKKPSRKEESAPFTAPEPIVDPHTYEGLKSVFISAENFKNIEAKVVNISGKSIAIVGRNGGGKSSLIQVIKGTLDSSNLPEVGLKEGTEEGRIIHRIAGRVDGEYMEYTIEYYFSKKHESGRIKVFDQNMQEVKSPATIIKNVIGQVSFSPVKFLNEKKEKKLQIIKGLTGKGKEIDIINYDIETKKKDISNRKNVVDSIEAELSAVTYTDDQKRLYGTPVPIEPINKKIGDLDLVNKQFNEIKRQRDAFSNDATNCQNLIHQKINETQAKYAEIERIQKEIENLNIDIQKLDTQKKTNEANIEIADKWMIDNPAPDMVSLAEELRIATEHNNHYTRILELSDKHKKLYADKQEIITIEKEVSELIAKRTQLIESSQLPVKGLSFTDSEILLNGLPFEEGQINTQTLWDVCIDIALAVNSNYKGVFIDDGSLIDREHLIAIVKKIEEKGGFAIIEMVNWDGGELEVKFTEELLK